MRKTAFLPFLVPIFAMLVFGLLFAGTLAAREVGETPHFQQWSQLYGELNGDADVTVPLAASTRVLTTRWSPAHGYARLNLLEGTAVLDLRELEESVDVYLLDNRPGPGRHILPEEGDTLILLGTLEPDAAGRAHLEVDGGPDFFRGIEVDWILVTPTGEDPATSRLLHGSRSYFERRFTRERLAREGFRKIGDLEPARDLQAIHEKSGTLVPSTILVKAGLVSQDVFDGGILFFHETFEGNGRTCGSCHPASNNQTIDPAFIATLPASDPLFVAEQRPPSDPISNLERPPLMRNFGLILENVDGLESPNTKFLMRSVPHSLSMSTSITLPVAPDGTIPDGGNFNFLERTGWSGDGAPPPGRLREFTLGAVNQHFPNNSLDRVFKDEVPPGAPFDFRRPTDEELDLTNEFMLNAGRTNDLDLSDVALANARAENGRALFVATACNTCHMNAGANFLFAEQGNRNFNTGVELVPNPAQGFAGINYPLDGGFGGQGLAAPNFDCDGDGVNDCFGNGTFNSTPLVEAADTGPFFHNDVALTIEDAVRFYTAAPFPAPIDLGGEAGVQDVSAFLRVINAGLNLQMAAQRSEAVLDVDFQNLFTPTSGARATANRLLDLSNAEIEDAIMVLTDGPLGNLHPDATILALTAAIFNDTARNTSSVFTRAILILTAVDLLHQADATLGTGVDYNLGSGNLLF